MEKVPSPFPSETFIAFAGTLCFCTGDHWSPVFLRQEGNKSKTRIPVAQRGRPLVAPTVFIPRRTPNLRDTCTTNPRRTDKRNKNLSCRGDHRSPVSPCQKDSKRQIENPCGRTRATIGRPYKFVLRRATDPRSASTTHNSAKPIKIREMNTIPVGATIGRPSLLVKRTAKVNQKSLSRNAGDHWSPLQ